MNPKKSLTLLLAAWMLTGSLASCGEAPAVSSDDPEFLRIFMDSEESDGEAEADEGMLMAILGDDSEDTPEDRTDEECDETE